MDLPIYVEFVHQDDRISEDVYDKFVEGLDLENISQRLADYRFTIHLKIALSRSVNDDYRAAVWCRLGRVRIHFSVGGSSLKEVAQRLTYYLDRELADRITKQKRYHRKYYQKQTTDELEAYCALLEEYAHQGRRADFILLISGLLDQMRGYVVRKLHDAYLRGYLVSSDAVDVDNLLDEVFEVIYKEFTKRPTDRKLLYWVYSVIDRIIERHIDRANKERTVHLTLEDLVATELEDLEEFRFVADAEGELYELEDFYEVVENPYYRLYSYEDFWPFDQSRPEEVDPHKLHVWVANKLAKLSERRRDIFDLYALEGMTDKEIAECLNIPESEVRKNLEEVRQFLRRELEKEWKGHEATPIEK